MIQRILGQFIALLTICIGSYTRFMKTVEGNPQAKVRRKSRDKDNPSMSNITEIYSLSSGNCAALYLQNGGSTYFS